MVWGLPPEERNRRSTFCAFPMPLRWLFGRHLAMNIPHQVCESLTLFRRRPEVAVNVIPQASAHFLTVTIPCLRGSGTPAPGAHGAAPVLAGRLVFFCRFVSISFLPETFSWEFISRTCRRGRTGPRSRRLRPSKIRSLFAGVKFTVVTPHPALPRAAPSRRGHTRALRGSAWRCWPSPPPSAGSARDATRRWAPRGNPARG